MSSLPLHDDLIELVYPASLSLSADGRRLAHAGVRDARAVHVIDPTAPGSAPLVWRQDAEVALARWSPDGTTLWIVTLAEHGEPTGLALLAGDGSTVATAIAAGAIEDVVPLADGSALLRVADVGSDRDGMHLGLRVTGVEAEDPVAFRSDAPPLRRLVRAVLCGDRLALQPVELGGWTVWDVDVVGTRAAVVASRDPSPAGYYRPTLLLVDDLDEPEPTVREVRRTDGQLARPRLSPDGDQLCVVEGQSIVSGVLHLFDLTADTCLTVPDLDDVTDVGWLDASSLWFAGWDDLGVQVGRVSDGTVTTRWTALATMHGDSGQPTLAIAPDGSTAYTVWEAPGHPPEVVVLAVDRPGTTPLTHHNALVRDLATDLITERVAWHSPDGTEVRGLLLHPAHAVGPLPLVLLLHGGPTWLWTAAFAPAESNHLAVPLAAAGAAVLLPNPRGSSGRGQAYATKVAGDLGHGDLADVLAGVDHLIERGVADADRSAVMGLSYGGYLTAQAAATTSRFRAAVVMSGVTDWLGFATTSAIGGGYDPTYLPDGDLGTVSGREALVVPSPLYAVRPDATPTLFLHGALDRITPLAQAEQHFGRLARAGVEAELVVYPREGHELMEPVHRRDAAVRVARWLRDHGVLDETED
jgi:dipeptidyl aminopeptidase/acylaminoacyl peptidase